MGVGLESTLLPRRIRTIFCAISFAAGVVVPNLVSSGFALGSERLTGRHCGRRRWLSIRMAHEAADNPLLSECKWPDKNPHVATTSRRSKIRIRIRRFFFSPISPRAVREAHFLQRAKGCRM